MATRRRAATSVSPWSDVVRFATCNEMFEGWPFPRVCRLLASLGYDGVELAPFTFAMPVTDWPAAARAEVKAQAAEAGLAIVGLHWLLARTHGLHLTAPDRETRDRTSGYLVELARACRDTGGSVLVFGSPLQRSLLRGVSHAQAMDHAAATFRAAMPAIADCGVRLCIEPLSPEETDFVNTCDAAMQLIDAVSHPDFVLQLDVKAMASEATPVPALIRRHAGRTGHFHANDPNRRGPGFGETDFVPIFQALEECRYAGWVSVEVFDYTPDPETIARKSLEYMKRCVASLEPTR